MGLIQRFKAHRQLIRELRQNNREDPARAREELHLRKNIHNIKVPYNADIEKALRKRARRR
jgi:hypothetical protein